MFSHVMVGSDNVEKSKTFYDALLTTLGYEAGVIDEKGRCFYPNKDGTFCISKPINGEPACMANGGTIGFNAESPEAVEAWHKAGIANGGSTCESPPGIREVAFGKMYLAYLRDPAGNKLCAVHRMS